MTGSQKPHSGNIALNRSALRSAYYCRRMARLASNIDQVRQIMNAPMYEELSKRSDNMEDGTDRQRHSAWLEHLEEEKDVLADQCRYLMNPKRLWLFDQRDQHGTGPLISLSRFGGYGHVIYFIDGEACTACSIKKFKLEGDEVTCDPSHRVVRHWKDGEPVVKVAVPVHSNGGRE